MRKTRRSAYTLFEMVLVTAVVGITAALVSPAIETMYADTKLTSAADAVRARWADARARAVEEGRAYRFEMTPGTGKFRVLPDEDQADSDQALKIEGELPNHVTFTTEAPKGDNAGSGEGGAEAIIFLPDGTADADRTITFSSPGSRSLVLRLRALTGAVTVSQDDQGEK